MRGFPFFAFFVVVVLMQIALSRLEERCWGGRAGRHEMCRISTQPRLFRVKHLKCPQRGEVSGKEIALPRLALGPQPAPHSLALMASGDVRGWRARCLAEGLQEEGIHTSLLSPAMSVHQGCGGSGFVRAVCGVLWCERGPGLSQPWPVTSRFIQGCV